MLKQTLAAGRLALVAVARAAEPEAAARYDAARDPYEVGHCDSAFTAFAALADEGHCHAARRAQQRRRHGRALYASDFKASLERVQRWQRTAACATPERQVARTP